MMMMMMMVLVVVLVIWIKRRVKTATIRRRMVVGLISTLTLVTTREGEDGDVMN